jgi:outer membrane protein OmpA-like peptidoglycan-associated protein
MKARDGSRAALAAALSLLALLSSAPAARSGPDDPPMITRYPEAPVLKRSVKALESYWVPIGKLFGDGQAEKVQVVEGKWTHLTYANPGKSSVIEIGRKFDQKLRDAGFEIVYDCRDGDCGSGGRKTNGDWWDPNYQRRYLVGKLERQGGDVWVCVNVWAKSASIQGQHDVDVIEAKPEPRVAQVQPDETDAGWLEHELGESGHVAVRGIGFDDKKSALTPSSEPYVQAIAQLLSRDPRRRLMVVVHSDGQGDVRGGIQRSRKQAAILVAALVKKHGVASGRILGEGVGPLAPLAPNGTPQGSALNRRVEVVLAPGSPVPGLKASQASE